MRKKLHFYAYSFTGRLTCGRSGEGSVYIGYHNAGVTKARIQEAKKGANMDPGAVLVAVSYLGRMTNERFSTVDPTE